MGAGQHTEEGEGEQQPEAEGATGQSALLGPLSGGGGRVVAEDGLHRTGVVLRTDQLGLQLLGDGGRLQDGGEQAGDGAGDVEPLGAARLEGGPSGVRHE